MVDLGFASLLTERQVFYDVRLMLSQIDGIIDRMCDKILGGVAFAYLSGREGSDLRRAVGILRADVSKAVIDNTLPDEMLNVFDAAYTAGITVHGLDPVLTQLWSETPTLNGSVWTTQAAIVFTLATQCRVIAKMEFVSREDIEAMQNHMRAAFDQAKLMAADELDNVAYLQLVDLSSKCARHLARTAMPLPTIVYYEMRPQPALAMANRIYADANRTEELMKDNKVVHPAFMRGSVRALSK